MPASAPLPARGGPEGGAGAANPGAEGGEIVERGTHPELLAIQGRYRELYEKQHGLERNLFLAPGEGDA